MRMDGLMSTSLPLPLGLLCFSQAVCCWNLPCLLPFTYGSSDHWEVSGNLQKCHLWGNLGTDTQEKPWMTWEPQTIQVSSLSYPTLNSK